MKNVARMIVSVTLLSSLFLAAAPVEAATRMIGPYPNKTQCNNGRAEFISQGYTKIGACYVNRWGWYFQYS